MLESREVVNENLVIGNDSVPEQTVKEDGDRTPKGEYERPLANTTKREVEPVEDDESVRLTSVQRGKITSSREMHASSQKRVGEISEGQCMRDLVWDPSVKTPS
jgi:hypothetical protein